MKTLMIPYSASTLSIFVRHKLDFPFRDGNLTAEFFVLIFCPMVYTCLICRHDEEGNLS